MSAGQESLDDALDRGVGNRQRRTARQRRAVHAEHASLGVDQGAAGKSIVDGEIQPNESIDLAAAPGAPALPDGTDDAEAGGDAPVTQPAKGKYEAYNER